MPDESCRTCGGELVKCSLCAECRKVTQWICLMCHIKTREQLHLDCLTLEPILVNSKNQDLLIEQYKIIKKFRISESSHKKNKLLVTILASLFIGFFTIGFGSLDNFDAPYTTASTTQPAEKVNIVGDTDLPNPITQNDHYDNCLGISDGTTMTVKCPTAYGYVHNAVLEIPQALMAQLHQKSFSLRGLSITENFDSALIQYEKKLYVANFVGL